MTRNFVPEDIDLTQADQLVSLYQSLNARPLESGEALNQWMRDVSELVTVVNDYSTRLNIASSCHTDDEKVTAAYLDFVGNTLSKLKPLFFELQKKLAASPFKGELDPSTFKLLARTWEHDVNRFTPLNIPLQTKEAGLITDYDKILGGISVSFEGKDQTPQQMMRYQFEPDRGLRQRAWEVTEKSYLAQKEKISAIFTDLLRLRHQVALNSGFSDYRAYMWDQYERFDYSPSDCENFAEAVKAEALPLQEALYRERMKVMGLDKLRPWDMQVDPQNLPPLKPFDVKDIPGFVKKVGLVFDRISPRLSSLFARLKLGANLDLESRKGKQPGGYQSVFEEAQQPFIFMNAAGLQRDVETLLHEGGHAFHSMTAFSQEISLVRSAPLEFCEVASMSMELLGMEHHDIFYPDKAEALRAKKTLLEGIIGVFTSVARVDLFQHWIYTHPEATAAEIEARYLKLAAELSPGLVDWSGYEASHGMQWQKTVHFFHCPFYYFEYAVAQLGALQVWLNFRQDKEDTLNRLFKAYALGATRPLPELYETAGLKFDFSRPMLKKLLGEVQRELAALS